MFVPPASQAGESDDTVMRYSSQYEERLDPFASFSRKVRKSDQKKNQRNIKKEHCDTHLHCSGKA